MEQRVKAYIKKNSMLNPGDTVLMGVSGGGDSMAMLHMMCALQEELQIHPVVVHVQHGIRGEEAERDRILVEETCKKWGICCSVYNYQVPNLAQEWKLGIEETGRIVRKEAFAKEIEKLGVSDISVKIALAHNKNDVAETMLHNLTRGSGLRGASGIQAVSGNIIRPFLCLERKEIDHYLLEKEIPYVTDSTNLEDHYTRNRIRHHVLPVLEQEINEQAVSHMASAAEKMAVADAFLRKMGHELAEKFRITDKKYCMTAGFWEKEEILKEYAVLEMLETVAGKRKDITKLHVEQVLNSRTLQTGKYLCLPYNIVVKRDYQGITIEEIGKKTAEIPEDYENIWKIESKEGAFCPQKDFTIKIFPYEGKEI